MDALKDALMDATSTESAATTEVAGSSSASAEPKEGLSDWDGIGLQRIKGLQSFNNDQSQDNDTNSVDANGSHDRVSALLTPSIPRIGQAFGKTGSPRKVKTKAISDINLTAVKQQELIVQQQYLHSLHREYNGKKEELAAKSKRILQLNQDYADLLEKLERFKEERAVLERHGAMGEEQTKELRRLKDEISKYNAYSRTLHFMYERLQRNKLVSDTRVEELKQMIVDAKKDLQSHVIRLREAENSERMASADLEKAKERAQAEQEEWKDRLAARREVMDETKEVLQFREKQIQEKTAIIAEVKGDLDAEGEQRLQRKVVTSKIKQLRLANDIAKRTERIDEYERAFKRIVEATGINSMNQVVEKFLSQNETVENLKAMIEEASSKIAKLSDEKIVHRKEAEQIRFSGLGHTNKQRKLIDDKEAEIDGVAKMNKQLQERTDFLQQVLRGIKDGILHISSQMDSANISGTSLSEKQLQFGALWSPIGSSSLSLTQTGGSSGVNGANTASGETGGKDELSQNKEPGSPSEGFSPASPGGGGGASPTSPTSPQNDDNEGNITASNDAEWFLQALAACEERISKVLDSLPNKDLRLDDLDQRLLDRYGHSRIVVNVNRASKKKPQSPTVQHNPFRKVAMKKVLQLNKTKDDKRSSKAGQSKKLNQLLVSKAIARKKQLQEAHEKLKAQAHQAEILAQEAEKSFQRVREAPDAAVEHLVAAENKAKKTRESLEAAQESLKNVKAKLEANEAELLQQQGGKKGETEGNYSNESDYTSSESSSEEEGNDEFENSVPVLGDRQGRELIKAENRHLLKFAEKKRKKIQKLATANEKVKEKGETLEKEVMAATKQEARRFSVIRPQRLSRLSYARKEGPSLKQSPSFHFSPQP